MLHMQGIFSWFQFQMNDSQINHMFGMLKLESTVNFCVSTNNKNFAELIY